METLYNVSIINKHSLWLESDEANPQNWSVLSKTQLESWLGRRLNKKEEKEGGEIVEYDDIIWIKFK